MKIRVFGYGNQSRRDDGAGWRVIELLEEMGLAGVGMSASHQLEVEDAEELAGLDAAIFVDAAIPESPLPLARSEVRPGFESHAVAHYLTPSDLLGLSQCLYGRRPRGFLFSIRGSDFNFGTTLSEEAGRSARAAADQIAELIRDLKLEDTEMDKPRNPFEIER